MMMMMDDISSNWHANAILNNDIKAPALANNVEKYNEAES